ncbi:MAG TPA: AI-2E family transporter [Syntrophomonadaceae bacterium]|nr:AI-2E family transporter [Syntrophomonadaceae bacterium]
MQRRTLRIIILCLLILAGGALFYYIRSLLVPFGIAVLLAYIIYPLVRSLEAREVKRSWAIFTVYAAGLILIGIFIAFFVPAMFDEAKEFGKILPVYVETWEEVQGYLDSVLKRTSLPVEGQQILRETVGHIRKGLLQGIRGFAQALIGMISLLPSLLLAPFLAYYFIKDFDHIKKGALSILPPNYRNDLLFLVREGDLIFSQFLRGHLLVSLIVGLLTGAGAALIKMPFAILIGVFTAVLDLIPFFGPVLAAIPVVGLALTISRWKGFVMLAIYLLVQQIEGSFLAPRLLGDRVGLHPVATVLVLLIGGYLAGPIGLIFAVPAAGLLRVVLHYLWEKIV